MFQSRRKHVRAKTDKDLEATALHCVSSGIGTSPGLYSKNLSAFGSHTFPEETRCTSPAGIPWSQQIASSSYRELSGPLGMQRGRQPLDESSSGLTIMPSVSHLKWKGNSGKEHLTTVPFLFLESAYLKEAYFKKEKKKKEPSYNIPRKNFLFGWISEPQHSRRRA